MPERPSKTGPSLFSIAVLLGIFFFIVFVIAMLMLPDHGKSLLKLAANSARPLQAYVANALLN